MSGIDEVLSEVDNVNRIVTNSEHIREELKIPADISDEQIAKFWFYIYYGVDEYPLFENVISYLAEERKKEE